MRVAWVEDNASMMHVKQVGSLKDKECEWDPHSCTGTSIETRRPQSVRSSCTGTTSSCTRKTSSTLDKPMGVHRCFIHPFLVTLICDTGGLSLRHPLGVLACKKGWNLWICLFLHHSLLKRLLHPCSPPLSNYVTPPRQRNSGQGHKVADWHVADAQCRKPKWPGKHNGEHCVCCVLH